jgi:hypothetical protein
MATGFCYRVQKDVVCEIVKDDHGTEKVTCDSARLCGLMADGCPITHDILKIPFPRKKS